MQFGDTAQAEEESKEQSAGHGEKKEFIYSRVLKSNQERNFDNDDERMVRLDLTSDILIEKRTR